MTILVLDVDRSFKMKYFWNTFILKFLTNDTGLYPKERLTQVFNVLF